MRKFAGIFLVYALCTFSLGGQARTDGNKTLLWGDTHLHTSLSLDAYLSKNFSSTPDSAYRFATGQLVEHPYTGEKVRLSKPLDFLVVSDHAEYLGVVKQLGTGVFPTEQLNAWQRVKVWLMGAAFQFMAGRDDGLGILSKIAGPSSSDVVSSVQSGVESSIPNSDIATARAWQEIIDSAERHNQPGVFTAFIGWEWSSIPAGANLHRVVITSAEGELARQFLPFSANDSEYPDELWSFLDDASVEGGADFIAIPHNSNVSRGFMFPSETSLRGKTVSIDWAEERRRWEGIVEITQIKGDSETHPALSPEDEFADFERFSHYLTAVSEAYTPRAGDFVRSALLTGLEMESRLGANPYRFGFIGSSDSHTGLSNIEEGSFWGKYALHRELENRSKTFTGIEQYGWQVSASGLAAVWAEENTRESIFAAFKRREVYATTGPRISVRIFAGDYSQGDELREDFAELARRGVPMGGEFTQVTDAPGIVVWAEKDPVSANLDRVQIVKGWLDGSIAREKIYDVAWSGERRIDDDGRLPQVTDTVNPETGDYSNKAGVASLSAFWRDPEFDPAQSAFYYARVLEIPTPRHSTLDAIKLGIAPEKTGLALSIQERAYTSPIFYQPTQ